MPNAVKRKGPLTPAQAKKKTETQRLRREAKRAAAAKAKLREERSKTLTGKLLNFWEDVLSK